MIVWCVILTALSLANIGFSIYIHLECSKNKKANLEVLAPMWEKHEKLLVQLLKRK